MEVFQKVLNDEEIIQIYNNISIRTNLEKDWAHHDLQHVKNVACFVELFLSQLGYDYQFIQEAKVAAILHDVGALEGKEGHTLRSYEYAKSYFDRKNIELKYKDMVLDAIRMHSDGFDTDNVMALTLILSDKLDIKYTRIAEGGYDVVGMRQIQYIKDIRINLQKDNINIDIVCDKNIDKKELEEYYFINKVFKAVIAFSKKMNLEPMVKFNNKNWDAFVSLKNSIV